MKHINYFDLGLWKRADELHYMVDVILPQFKNTTYTAYGIKEKSYCLLDVLVNTY